MCVKRFMNFSDKEPSTLTLKDAATQSLPFVDSLLESCPVSDHHANGSMEVCLRDLKGEMRAIR